MRGDGSWIDPDMEAERQTASLAGLAVTLALVAACLFLIQRLAASSRIEDCMMAGRSDCNRLVAVFSLTTERSAFDR